MMDDDDDDDDDDECGAVSEMLGSWNPNAAKTCLSAALSTTNLIWPDPGSNLGRRGEKPATNGLSYVKA
jgi:hypothetical protein